jgi:hypothetical protein
MRNSQFILHTSPLPTPNHAHTTHPTPHRHLHRNLSPQCRRRGDDSLPHAPAPGRVGPLCRVVRASGRTRHLRWRRDRGRRRPAFALLPGVAPQPRAPRHLGAGARLPARSRARGQPGGARSGGHGLCPPVVYAGARLLPHPSAPVRRPLRRGSAGAAGLALSAQPAQPRRSQPLLLLHPARRTAQSGLPPRALVAARRRHCAFHTGGRRMRPCAPG